MVGQNGASGAGSEHLFVGNWCVTVGPYGIEVGKAAAVLPGAPLRQRPAGGVLPEAFPGLLGRQDEVEVALTALREQELLEVYGECGIGKTSLLRHLAHRAVTAFPDLPIIYTSAAGQVLGDLLQTLFTLLYGSDVGLKPAHPQLRHELRRAQAILLLDEVELGSQDLAELLRAVPDCQVVFASSRRRLATEGRSLGLVGLDEQASSQLVTQALGRGLQRGEHAHLQQVWNLLAGHPLRLLQAAAVVREADQTFPELVSALQAGDPVKVLQQMCATGLSAQQRRVVAVLAITGGMLLPKDLVEAMSSVANSGAELRELYERGIVEQQGDRYGLPVCRLGPPRRLIGPTLDRSLALRNLAEWLDDPCAQPDDLLKVSNAVLKLLEFAGEAGESETVIKVVRALEPVLILSGRWEAWRYSLDQGVQAARAIQHFIHEAHFLHQVGSSELALGDPHTALDALDKALDLRARYGPREAQMVTHHNIKLAHDQINAAGDRRPREKKDVGKVAKGILAGLGAVALVGLTAQSVASAIANNHSAAQQSPLQPLPLPAPVLPLPAPPPPPPPPPPLPPPPPPPPPSIVRIPVPVPYVVKIRPIEIKISDGGHDGGHRHRKGHDEDDK